MLITLTEDLPDSMYYWAMRSQTKDGEVVFKSKTANAPLKVQFFNGYCVDLDRSISEGRGLTSDLIISAEKVVINGVELDNRWTKR